MTGNCLYGDISGIFEVILGVDTPELCIAAVDTAIVCNGVGGKGPALVNCESISGLICMTACTRTSEIESGGVLGSWEGKPDVSESVTGAGGLAPDNSDCAPAVCTVAPDVWEQVAGVSGGVSRVICKDKSEVVAGKQAVVFGLVKIVVDVFGELDAVAAVTCGGGGLVPLVPPEVDGLHARGLSFSSVRPTFSRGSSDEESALRFAAFGVLF